jgi:hypothetical protein
MPNNPQAQNNRAWFWATCPDATYRDGLKAVDAATKAALMTKWKDFEILDTLAAAFAETGDFDKAIEWQTKAIELCTDEKTQQTLKTRLELYEKKTPYREGS